MKGRVSAVVLLTVALAAATAPAVARCTLSKLAELPVTMTGLRPIVSANINGADATFIADSGAFYSMLSPNAAAQFKLSVQPLPFELLVWGVGGASRASYTTVKTFTLANISFSKLEFIVAGSDVGSGAAGLIGQNILGFADVEYDLANGAIRIMKPKDCDKTVFAYWAADKPYSVMDIDWATQLSPHTMGTAYVNGTRIRVLFDTGAAQSILTQRAAERAGLKPGGQGVVMAGFSHGVGRRGVQTYIGPFASFKIGDEEVRNTRLRFGDISLEAADMLVGADFFLSHRIYVAKSQRKLYFTYNGGPVFNLEAVPLSLQTAREPGAAAPAAGAGADQTSGTGAAGTAGAAGDATSADASAAPGSTSSVGEPGSTTAGAATGSAQPKEILEQPTDAAGYSRRGTAFAARHDYEHAIADLTRACELAPNESQYFYERGTARLGNRQPFQAMTDFDQALKLKPDHVPSLMMRAELRLDGRDPSSAAADLDAVDRIAPKESDVRLGLGNLYLRSGRFASAIAQFDSWLPAHYDDARRFEGLSGRCRSRALLGQDLPKALSDCNDALKVHPGAPGALDSRGLVRLRMGDFDKSIADYDAALSLQPKLAWALYGRGLDELHKGMTSQGQADIAAATALQPMIANQGQHVGLTP
jgi:tetratricopeptide (TPR) repeat protein/predicted aspartyl protease